MALINNREKKICEKYRAYDSTGHVHCYECPLNKGNPNNYDFRCKANSHYDRHTKEWELDCSAGEVILTGFRSIPIRKD